MIIWIRQYPSPLIISCSKRCWNTDNLRWGPFVIFSLQTKPKTIGTLDRALRMKCRKVRTYLEVQLRHAVFACVFWTTCIVHCRLEDSSKTHQSVESVLFQNICNVKWMVLFRICDNGKTKFLKHRHVKVQLPKLLKQLITAVVISICLYANYHQSRMLSV